MAFPVPALPHGGVNVGSLNENAGSVNEGSANRGRVNPACAGVGGFGGVLYLTGGWYGATLLTYGGTCHLPFAGSPTPVT
jgi:hypothetical protein